MRNNNSMSYYPPLGLCYIAGMLERQGIEVCVIDRQALMTKSSERLIEVNEITKNELNKFDPNIVGITATTATFFDVRKNLLSLIKDTNKETTIVLGGSHVSAMPKHVLLQNSNVDIVCRGEGEIAMLEIAMGKRREEIHGIVYRNESDVISNAAREPYMNVDNLCFPARHLVDMKFYTRANPVIMHGLYMRATTIYTSRGCAFDCAFCAGKVAAGKKVRYQSSDLVIEEIERLVKDYNVEGIYFADDMFDVNVGRADTICEKLIKKGLNKKVCIYPQLRANNIDKKRLELMKKAGVIRVDLGFESGSQRILDAMNKKTTVEQNYKAAKMLHDAGLQFQANVIVGFPGEEEEDINKTALMLKETRPHWINFGEFLPLPGSKIYDDLIAKNLIKEEMLEYTEPYNLTKLDDKTFGDKIQTVRKKIVLPTRIKSYLKCHINRPMAFIYLLKLIFGGIPTRIKQYACH